MIKRSSKTTAFDDLFNCLKSGSLSISLVPNTEIRIGNQIKAGKFLGNEKNTKKVSGKRYIYLWFLYHTKNQRVTTKRYLTAEL